MPDMPGDQLVARVRDLLPAVRVVYMSGLRPDRLGELDAFLQKPIDLTQLLGALRSS